MTRRYSCLGPQGFGSYEVEWTSAGPRFSPTSESADGLLSPGFVDIHIHGANGIDFMTATPSDLDALCEQLAGLGYEAFLPTTVTASLTDVVSAIGTLEKCKNHLIAGFHLEGPFLSPSHPGAQAQEAIVSYEAAEPGWTEALRHRLLRVATIAPEEPGGLRLTKELSDRGVHVSLGHTDATCFQAWEAFVCGARGTTHTFNAMRGLHHREPGTVGFALTADEVYAELIYDRHHVSWEAADVLFRCKGPDKVVAVSDGTAASGLPEGTKLAMWGQECSVSNGSVRLVSTGALAGSAVTLLDCFRNLCEDFGQELAVRACAINPRRVSRIYQESRVWVEFDPSLVMREIHKTHTY